MVIELLTSEEARVLGTLIEKSLATPDYYPLTLNSLRTACNQKSNRDPVTEYSDDTVLTALKGLKLKVLVTFIPYGSQGNQYKYRHFLEDPRFQLSTPEIAVIGVLLLRGAQTLNEVKLRASSLHPLASLEETESVLTKLANRSEPLVEQLPKRPGWKEPRWKDLLQPEAVIELGNAAQTPLTTSQANLSGLEGKTLTGFIQKSPASEIAELKLEMASLKQEVAELKIVVEKINEQITSLF